MVDGFLEITDRLEDPVDNDDINFVFAAESYFFLHEDDFQYW